MKVSNYLAVFALMMVAASSVRADDAPFSGRELYTTHCMQCHQVNGSGVPNMQPALKGSKKATGDPEALIKFVLKGSADLDPSETIYTNIMTAYDFLSDSELAAILTYVRSSFGNDALQIRAEDVANARNP